jgi:LacI family transcriptional regulator
MNRFDRVTIKHVAEEAGVSIKTVSRVINNLPDVSPVTRQSVLEVIKRLGYQPNAIARSLVSRRTRTIGIINADFNDEFFSSLLKGAELAARRYGYFIMLASTENNTHGEPEYIRLITERYVEGILFAQPGYDSDQADSLTNGYLYEILQASIPVAIFASGKMPIMGKLTILDIDNIEGGKQATQCLLKHGHSQLAMIMGPQSRKAAKDRTNGFMLALGVEGIKPDDCMMIEGDWSYQSGEQAAQRLLNEKKTFTGVFAQNDRMAMGAIKAFRNAGFRIPEDISIVGYDDSEAGKYYSPPLTTIRQPIEEIGEIAVLSIIHAIEEKKEGQKEVVLQTEIVERSSCTKVNRKRS